MTEINQNPDQNNSNNNPQTEQAQTRTQTGTQGQANTSGWTNTQAPMFTRKEYIEKLRVAFLKGDAEGLYNGLAQVPAQYNPQAVLHEALSQADKPSLMDRIKYRKMMDWVVLGSASVLSAGAGVAGTMYAMAPDEGAPALSNNSEEGVHSPSVVDFQQSA